MAGIAGAMKMYNEKLVDYGIQNEDSHIRVHVCPKVQRVYVYPTDCGISAIQTGQYHNTPGFQAGIAIPTAMGYLVPPFDIKRCVALSLNGDVWDSLGFQRIQTTTIKGQKAVRLIVEMLKQGLFPIPVQAYEITDRDLQIKGADVVIKAGTVTKDDIIIQVKCDFDGGEKELGGTGNLYLQVAECNPLRRH